MDEKNLLDHYFASVYEKLEADALSFNRNIPHTGLVGSENEQALAKTLREFLPPRFGIDVSAILIDKNGGASKQIDIVIYDAEQPKFFRKIFPIEIVYATIEVKTSMGQTEALSALENMKSIHNLDFRPALTPYWQTRTSEQKLHHDPPASYIFAFRTNCESYETFAGWFPWGIFNEGVRLRDAAPVHPEIRKVRIVALDQGTIEMASTNGYVDRKLPLADLTEFKRGFDKKLKGQLARVDPAKVLFFFMNRLWFDLEYHPLHPGFDIRSYTSNVLGSYIPVED